MSSSSITSTPIAAPFETASDTARPDTVRPDTDAPDTIAPVPTTDPVQTTVPSAIGRRLASIGGAVWDVARPFVAIGTFLAIWETFPRWGIVDTVFVPPLSQVLQAWWALLTSGQLVVDAEASLVRSATGLGLAVVTAIPLGILIGWYRPLALLLNPLLELFRNTAPLALLPVFVLVLGLGETSKISLIFYACLWPILLNTISGVRTVDPLLIKSARSLGLPAPRLFQKVVLPAAVPTIFTGVRLAAAYSILILIAAELVGAKAGLGYLITNSQYNFSIPDMYAGIITISGIGLTVNLFLVAVERRFATWRTSL